MKQLLYNFIGKPLGYLFLGCAVISCSPKEIRLQWNPSWRTDTAYELTFDPEKIGGDDWVASADGCKLETDYFFDGTFHRLRFSVPTGTKKMALVKGLNRKVASDTLHNLYSDFKKSGAYRIRVPEWAAGRPARMELDAENTCDMTVTVKMYFRQYHDDGTIIPEEVSDGRWTTHAQPPHTKTCYRERAYIHPDAGWIEFFVDMDPLEASYDMEGKPISEIPAQHIDISHIAIRPAAEYPFPGFNEAFFSEGVSGTRHDRSLNLSNGKSNRTFVYQTRSWASWAGGYQIRNPYDCFYPVAQGCVEAWFKPDWSSSVQADGESIPLFEASHHASIVYTSQKRFALGRQLFLTYDPRNKIVRLELKDKDMRLFAGECISDIADKEWSHIAVTFEPDKKAKLYVNGRKSLTIDLAGYKTVDIENVEFPNDRHAMEFYVGASYVNARGFTENDRKWQKITDWCDSWYSGLVDGLRVSSDVRYTSDFVPAKEFALDRETRALFNFNDEFDGRCGAGIGVIHGTVMGKENRNTLKVVTDKGKIQYYPESVAPENDPKVLLKLQNYPDVPEEADYNSSYRKVVRSFILDAGDEITVKVNDEPVMDFIEIENLDDKPLVHPLVRREDEIDFRSYANISETLPNKSDPVSLFNYLIGASDYFMTYQASFAKHSDEAFCAKDESMTVLGSYCGFECGPLNRLTASIYASSCGIPSSPICGYGHEYQQIFYGGRNHIYDLSGQKFYVDMDNESAAGQEGFEDQPAVLERAGTSPGHFVRMGTRYYYNYSQMFPELFAMNVNPGEKLKLYWANNGTANDLQAGGTTEMHENDRTDYRLQTGASNNIWRIDRFFPEYGNGFLLFDGCPADYPETFTELEKESFCYLVETCYPVVAADYEAILKDGSRATLDISTDNRHSFSRINGHLDYRVRGRRGYYIRINAPIDSIARFRASTVLHSNTRVQTGKLMEGKNLVHFTAEGDGKAKITFGYDVRDKDICFSNTLKYGSIPGYETHLIPVDPCKGPVIIPVAGVGKDVSVTCSDSLDVKIINNNLEIKSISKTPSFGWIKVSDKERYRYLTVLSCPDIRIIYFNDVLNKDNPRATASFEDLDPGEYAVLSLERFSGGIPARRERVVSLEFGDNTVKACSPINQCSDYYKAAFGPVGGKGNWKWDFPLSDSYSYPFDQMGFIEVKSPVNTISYTMTDFKYGEMELNAALIIKSPDRDFKCEILKTLCGLNIRPWLTDNDTAGWNATY